MREELREERILIFAPRGRDAEVMSSVLTHAGFLCRTVDSFERFVADIAEGAGAAIVAQEALQAADSAVLRAWLERQEHWSDFPFVVLLSQSSGLAADGAHERLGELGNVVLLERPLNVQTLRSAALSALRARARKPWCT